MEGMSCVKAKYQEILGPGMKLCWCVNIVQALTRILRFR